VRPRELIGRVRRGVPAAAWLCALVAATNAIAWSLLTPPLQVPDEQAHIYYVQQLAETGKVPNPEGDESISPQNQTLRGYSHLDDINVGYLGRPAWTSSEGKTAKDLIASETPVGGGGSVGVGLYPPLYYATLAVPYLATKAAGGHLLEQLVLMRILSALYAGITVLLVFMFLRELLPRAPWAWVAGGLACGLQPLFAFESGGVSPDSLLALFSAATFYLVARAFRRGLTVPLGVTIGAMVMLATLSKLAALGLIPGLIVAGLLLVWRAGPERRREAVKALVAAALTFGVPMGIYLVFSQTVWDRPFFAGAGTAGVSSGNASGALAGVTPSFSGYLTYTWQLLLPRLSFMKDWLPGFLPNEVWFHGWIGRFGWGGITFDPYVYTWALRASGVVVALLVVSMARKYRALWRHLREFAAYLAIGLGLIAFYGYVGYHYYLDTGFTFEQARYLFPLLALYGGLIAVAVSGLGRRLGAAAGATLVVFAFAHDIAALMLTVGRFYA
jgi:Predicted membrane protein (DUF2142)